MNKEQILLGIGICVTLVLLFAFIIEVTSAQVQPIERITTGKYCDRGYIIDAKDINPSFTGKMLVFFQPLTMKELMDCEYGK